MWSVLALVLRAILKIKTSHPLFSCPIQIRETIWDCPRYIDGKEIKGIFIDETFGRLLHMLSLEKKRFKDYTITIFTYMMDFHVA